MERMQPVATGRAGQPAVEERNIVFTDLTGEEMLAELVLPDTQHGEYTIPLSEGLPTKEIPGHNDPRYAQWKAAMEWENILVPLAIKRLTRQQEITDLRPGCRLYLFRDGYLWRELEVGEFNRRTIGFRDINLAAFCGKDERIATCTLETHILMPFRMDGYEARWEMAFSETPWTWKNIESLGGLAPDDPRNTTGKDCSTSAAHEARARRCTPITFSKEQLKNKETRLQEDEKRPGHYTTHFRYASDIDWLNNDLTLFMQDPLQEAREQKERHNALIDIHAHCQQSAVGGPLGLAGLIDDLIGEEDPHDLSGGTAIPSHEQLQRLLEQGARTRDVLPGYIEQAETELLPILQSEDFLIAMSDYTESSDLRQRKLGVDHLAFLIDDLAAPASLVWLHDVFEGRVAELMLAKGEDEQVNQQLREHAEYQTWQADDPLLKGLPADAYTALALTAPKALEALLEAASKSYLAVAKGNPQNALEPLAALMRRFSKLDLKVVSTQMRHWLPDPSVPLAGPYRFAPAPLVEAIHKLGQRTAMQLTLGDNLQHTLHQLHNKRGMRGVFMSVIGPLLLVDTALAIHVFRKDANVEAGIEVSADFFGLVSYMVDQFKFWAGQRSVQLEGRVAVMAEKNARGVQRVSALKSARLITGAKKIVRTVVFKGFHFIAAISETALGAWRIGRGVRTGNLGVATGSFLEMSGGIMMLIALLPGVGATMVLLGVLFGVAGAIVRILSEYSQLQKVVKYGWFGNHAYDKSALHKENLAFSETARAQRGQISNYQYVARLSYPERYFDQATSLRELQGWRDNLPQINLEPEINAVNREMFRFDASLRVHALGGDTLGIASRYVVELFVSFGAFSPFNTALDGEIYVGDNRYPLSDCYLVEQFDPQNQRRLTGLRCMVEVRHHSRVHSKLRLDPAGDNHWLPEGAPATDRWQADVGYYSGKARNILSLSLQEWERLKVQARRKPYSDSPVSLLVDTGRSCEAVSERQAKVRPLLSIQSLLLGA